MTDNPLSGKVSLDVTDFKAGIAQLNRDIRVIESGFRATAAGLGDWSKSATGLEARIKALNSEIDLQRKKTDALRDEYERVVAEKGATSRAAQELEIRLNRETETLNKMERELVESERALSEMKDESRDAGKAAGDLADRQDEAAGASGRLRAALDKVKGSIKEVGKDLKDLGDKVLKGVAAGIAGVTAALAGFAVGFGAAAFGIGKTMDEAFDTILIGTGAIGEELEGLKDDFKAVFTSIPVDAAPAARVIADLNTRLGLTGDGLQDTSRRLLEMTRLLGGDAAQNAALFARVIGDAGIPVEESGRLLDLLFRASQETGVGLESLMQKVVQFGAPMRLMGFTLEDSIALFSKWEKEGVNAELVMGSLRIAAGKFAKEGKPLRDSLFETFKFIQQTTDESAALAKGMEVFGARAGPDMTAAIREGRFEIEELVKALENADGAILETASATEDWGEKFTRFRNKAMVALEPVGSAIFGIAGAILDRLEPVLEGLLPTIERISETLAGLLESPEFQAGLDAIAGGIAGLTETVTNFIDKLLSGDVRGALAEVFPPEVVDLVLSIAQTVGAFLKDVLIPFARKHLPALKGALVGVLAVLGGAAVFAAISAALTALVSPIGLIIAGAALLGAAWAENWGGIRTMLTDFWENTGKPIFEELKAWLAENIPVAIEALSQFWTGTLQPALSTFFGWLQSTIFPLLQEFAAWYSQRLVASIKTLTAFWTGTLQPALSIFFTWLQSTVFPLLSRLWDWLAKNIPEAIKTLKGFWENTLLPAIKAVWAFVQNDLFPLFRGIADFMDAAFSLAITALAGLWQNVLQPALEAIWKVVKEDLWPILKSMGDWLQRTLGPIVETMANKGLANLKSAFESIRDAIGWVVDKLASLTDALRKVKLPDWLTPGSPTPFENALRGISAAMDEINRKQLPRLTAGLAPASTASASQPAPAPVTYIIHEHFYSEGAVALGLAITRQASRDRLNASMG